MYLINVFLLLSCWKSIFLLQTHLKVNDRYCGFSVQEKLKNLLYQDKITSADVRNLKEASNIVVAIVEKNTEKSPLHFSECIWSDFIYHFRAIWIKSQHEKPFDSLCIIKDSYCDFSRKDIATIVILVHSFNSDSENAKPFDYNDTRLDHFFFNESLFKMPKEL